jgi:hypothetical protein
MPEPNGTRTNRFSPAAQRAGVEVRQARADQRAADLAPIINELRAAGTTSSKGIAQALNERGVLTPRGGRWYAMQVSRVLKRLAAKTTSPRRFTGPCS